MINASISAESRRAAALKEANIEYNPVTGECKGKVMEF